VIKLERTPNPLSRQFSTGRPFVESGYYSFYTKEDAVSSLVAQEVLMFESVAHILITPMFVTVTLTDEALWEEDLDEITRILNQHADARTPFVSKNIPDPCDGAQSGDMFETIAGLIEEHVTPSIASHGGYIKLINIEDDIVYLELQGACDGCPSALVTLKNGIENLIRFYVPSIKEVRAVNLES